MVTIANPSTRALLTICGEKIDLQRHGGAVAAAIETPRARLPLDAMVAIWEAARSVTDDETLGLRAASAVPVGAFGTLDLLALTSSTVLQAIDRLSRYYRLAHGGANLTLERTRNGVVAVLDETIPSAHLRDSVAFSFAILVARLRQLSGVVFEPMLVEFGTAQPSNAAAFDAVFGRRVRFDAKRHLLGFTNEVAALPLAGSDAALAEILEARAARELLGLANATSIVDHARAAVRQALARGDASIEAVAGVLSTAPRSLQRHLHANGTSFRDLVAEVRSEIARDLLARGVPLEEIAPLLAFSDARALSRAFRCWTGLAPNDYRQLTLKH